MSQFFQIPSSIMFYKGLSSDEKIVFGLINGYLNKKERCFYTDEALSEVIGSSIRTIQRIIAKLRKLNLIEIEGHTFRRKFKYGSNFIQIEHELKSGVMGDTSDKKLNSYDTNDVNIRHERHKYTTPMTLIYDTDDAYNKEQIKEQIKEQQPSPPVERSQIERSSPLDLVVVFSKLIDKQLINFIFDLPEHLRPTFQSSDFELLSACKFHIDIQLRDEKISLNHALNKLKKLMQSHQFQKPNGFESINDLEKKKEEKNKVEERLRLQEESSLKKWQEEEKIREIERKRQLETPITIDLVEHNRPKRLGGIVSRLAILQ